jgi:hypothetical protein
VRGGERREEREAREEGEEGGEREERRREKRIALLINVQCWRWHGYVMV